jgi:LysR family transcriptional regulator for bpeEF and oprC
MQPALPFALAFNVADAQLACALRDQGVLQTVDLLLIHEIRAGRLEQILGDWTAPGPAMAAVYPSAHRHSAKVRVFADFAADLLTRLRTEFDAAA